MLTLTTTPQGRLTTVPDGQVAKGQRAHPMAHTRAQVMWLHVHAQGHHPILHLCVWNGQKRTRGPETGRPWGHSAGRATTLAPIRGCVLCFLPLRLLRCLVTCSSRPHFEFPGEPDVQ